MTLISLPSRFFTAGRSKPIRYIVIHSTEGTDSRRWLTETGNVSAHYLVREEATYALVDETNTAWHAGVIIGTPTTPLYQGGNPNDESIGIEMEGFAGTAISPTIIAATADLIRDIRQRRGALPLVLHSELSPGSRSDPGSHNIVALEAALNDNVDDDFERRYLAMTAKHVSPTLEAIKDAFHRHHHNDPEHKTSGPIVD